MSHALFNHAVDTNEAHHCCHKYKHVKTILQHNIAEQFYCDIQKPGKANQVTERATLSKPSMQHQPCCGASLPQHPSRLTSPCIHAAAALACSSACT